MVVGGSDVIIAHNSGAIVDKLLGALVHNLAAQANRAEQRLRDWTTHHSILKVGSHPQDEFTNPPHRLPCAPVKAEILVRDEWGHLRRYVIWRGMP